MAVLRELDKKLLKLVRLQKRDENFDGIDEILEAGADINAVDSSGNTLLIIVRSACCTCCMVTLRLA